ncbi:protein AAR2 homolog [Leptinotarsa decemlineata]|uniref:protein AAR2 homolog n=1 Tax=Leptinotarsa decemlineata TaxID=7539 RepID=UPI000C254213|nr:protein AAR2 homolog [Leptinotarsa decemlineata]
MDQPTAKKLLAEGAFFILLGVPEGTEFGIDMKSWNTGDKFRGVKMIPPGIHFIFFSAVSEEGDTAPRTGFFKNFRKSEVFVKKWDVKNECISVETVSEDEVVNLKDNIMALDDFLGPYPYAIKDKWLNLSSSITESLIEKLTPLSGYIQSALELVSCSDADRPRGKSKSEHSPGGTSTNSKRSRLSDDFEERFLPELKPLAGTELRFTAFPEKNYPAGSTPAEITRHSLDSTYVLDQVLTSYQNPSDILGELQACYICFLVGHSLEAFEHWKKLVNLFCSCEIAIKKHRRLYDMFLSIIEVHVAEIPEEFLADIVANDNFVYMKLRRLFGSIQASQVDGILKTKADRLRKSLTEKYLWDFEHLNSEEEDEAPVVVET